jgi:O-antigen biosynthesis protein WbqP
MRVCAKPFVLLRRRMKRVFDIALALFLGVILLVPILVIGWVIRLTSKGPAIYWSDRIGKNSKVFKMAKLRTMRSDAPALATHLLPDPEKMITPIGRFLRKTSLDEVPQLWNILRGDMSFVGPRPALFNQDDLIELRKKSGVDQLVPGITGWAQLNGRDELSSAEKVFFDRQYQERQSFWFDLQIMALTVIAVVQAKNITH